MRPLLGAPDVVSWITDIGSKGYPFLGLAWGAKEAGLLGRGKEAIITLGGGNEGVRVER